MRLPVGGERPQTAPHARAHDILPRLRVALRVIATVEDGRLVRLRADDEHRLSKGFAYPRGIAMEQVVNDPDRLLCPLRGRPGVARGEGGT